MPIYETFSRRRKEQEQGAKSDVFVYDSIPSTLRVQINMIVQDSLGPYIIGDTWSGVPGSPSNRDWEAIYDILAREYGRDPLAHGNSKYECLHNFLLMGSTEEVIDFVELAFRFVDRRVRKYDSYEQAKRSITQSADDAINELNHRFLDHGIGYEYGNGILVRVDSQFMHSEVIKPAISLLRNAEFIGASNEFFRAHEHYRENRNKEAIAEALKAWESTMKAICDKRKWSRNPNANAVQLVKTIIDNELVPSYLQTHFDNLRAAMESGLNTVRNKTSGHGQGSTIVPVPDHFVAYALHLAAANIVFLVECDHALS